MNYNPSLTREKLKTYIQQYSQVEKEKIKNDSLIFKEGFFDSMGFMMLITYIEEEFGIKTVDADLFDENFESINAIGNFIDRKTMR
jgi:acyl carrier protein